MVIPRLPGKGYGLRVVSPGYLLRNPQLAQTVLGEGDVLVVTGFDSQVLETATKTLPAPRVRVGSLADEGFILMGGTPSSPVVALALWHPSTRWASPIVMSMVLEALGGTSQDAHTRRALVYRAVNGHLAGLDTLIHNTRNTRETIVVHVSYRSLTGEPPPTVTYTLASRGRVWARGEIPVTNRTATATIQLTADATTTHQELAADTIPLLLVTIEY